MSSGDPCPRFFPRLGNRTDKPETFARDGLDILPRNLLVAESRSNFSDLLVQICRIGGFSGPPDHSDQIVSRNENPRPLDEAQQRIKRLAADLDRFAIAQQNAFRLIQTKWTETI